jgi:protein tyrosine/serine phosphatase
MRNALAGAFMTILLIAVGCTETQTVATKPAETHSSETPSAAARPSKWAEPVELAGVPNLHKVTETLYRSAQPTAEGMVNLKAMGIKTVVSLRSFHSDRDEIGDTELGYEHIYMKAWHPEEKEIARFLEIMADPEQTPVLVHCMHGADRTGTMCAIYRIAEQEWTKEEALKEMTDGGFEFHGVFDNLLEWVEKLDVAALKKEAATPGSTHESEDG